MANKQLIALTMSLALVTGCIFGMAYAVNEDVSGADYSGNTYGVSLVEGVSWSYKPTFSVSNVTVSVSGVPWLSVNNGTISGTAPSQASGSSAVYNLTITASATQPTQTAQQFVTLTVYDTMTVSGSASKTTFVGGSVSLTSSSNFSSGVTWSASNLPNGLSVNASTGTISGTATASGTKTAVITGTHAASGQSKTYSVAFTVTGALSVTSGSAMYGVNGKAVPTVSTDADYYKLTASASGVTWAVKSGNVPGLTFNSNGTITGTPSGVGSFTVVVTCTETLTGQSVDFTLTVVISAPIAFDSIPTGGILIEVVL